MDDTLYHHARHLRCKCWVSPEIMASGMGLTVERFVRLEATDMEFWSRQMMRAYLMALGYSLWSLSHKSGRTRTVIAQARRTAAREAGWPQSECESIEPVDTREWIVRRS